MRGLLIVAGSLSLVALWLLLAPMPRSSARPATVASAVSLPHPAAVVSAGSPRSPVAEKRGLLQGDALARRLDEQLPTRLYAEASRCYHGGLPPDQRLDLHYRLRVFGGALSVSQVQVEASTLGDSSLEHCIVDRLEGFRDRDAELPDLDEAGDLFVSVGGFKPFLARAD